MKPKKYPNVDVGRNSSLYFAVGLNIMLFFSWSLLEYKTYNKSNGIKIETLSFYDEQIEEDIPITNYTPPPPPPPILKENLLIVENAEEVEETFFESTEISFDDKIADYEPVNISDIEVAEVEEDVDVPFAAIENVPIFPGCENLKESERKSCFEQKITEHLMKHFNYLKLAKDLYIEGRVYTFFVIDNQGKVANLKSRGPNKILEQEAERIIGLLPKMIPGKQRGKPVRVSYALPILFKLQLE